jgi:PTH1 family peptidyl-tRNA hydrolase
LLVARPETYMNRSGEAVRALLGEFRSEPADLVVVCDDAALDRGLLRVRSGGSDGGHRGLRSIIESLGTEQFARLRLGFRTAGLGGRDLAEEVLAPFTPAEREVARELARTAAQCLDVILEQGLQVAMNRYNRRQPRDPEDPAAGQQP